MKVNELIKKLEELNQDKTVFVSCEAGCVVDDQIVINQENDKVAI
ncbi:hypothetical protein [Peribacillus frigoritolerans]